jgi:hypothetical protein
MIALSPTISSKIKLEKIVIYVQNITGLFYTLRIKKSFLYHSVEKPLNISVTYPFLLYVWKG